MRRFFVFRIDVVMAFHILADAAKTSLDMLETLQLLAERNESIFSWSIEIRLFFFQLNQLVKFHYKNVPNLIYYLVVGVHGRGNWSFFFAIV